MRNFIKFLIDTNRAKLAFWLAVSVFACFALIKLRVIISGQQYFLFLVWNLFLAFIPYAISTFTAYFSHRSKNWWLLAGSVSLWLLFFPNAPYILTDLFHLRHREGAPLWFDLLLILSFAWTGLILGYVSLADIQEVVSRTYNKVIGWLFAVGALMLSGFGIYLGRFERWNSWDIVSNPKGLVKDILLPILNPMGNMRVWGISAAFAIFLIMGYFTIKQMGKLAAGIENKD